MRTSRGSSCLRLLFLCLLLSPLAQTSEVAHADEVADFLKHYDQAIRLYESGQYQDSLKEFQNAYAIKQLPKLLLNLGQVHRRLGHAKDALGYYEFYLRVEPNPEPKLKAELDRYITQTRAMLEAAKKVRADAGIAEANKEPAEEAQAPPPLPAARDKATAQPVPSSAPPAPPAQPAAVTAPSTAPAVRSQQSAPAAQPGVPPGPVPAQRTQEARLPLVAGTAQHPADEQRRVPVYKRAWFWGVMGTVGAVVVAGVVTGAVLGTESAGASVPGNIEIQRWGLGGRP